VIEYGSHTWLGLFLECVIHRGNDGVLHQFVLVECCHRVRGLASPYPMPLYRPVSPWHDPTHPSLVHVTSIVDSVHMPHACMFPFLEIQLGVPPCFIQNGILHHQSLNPFVVHNHYLAKRVNINKKRRERDNEEGD
jgi:hypothetical protein